MHRPKNNAFTLIELLVVISIIALLVGILLPALGAARRTAQGVVCQTHQKNLSTAFVAYATDNNAFFPGWSLLVFSDIDNEAGAWIPNGSYLNPTQGATTARDFTKGSIYPYASDKGVFVCPSDPFSSFSSDLSYTISNHIYRQPNRSPSGALNWPEKGTFYPAYTVDPAVQTFAKVNGSNRVMRYPNSDKFRTPSNLAYIVDEGGAEDGLINKGVNDGYFENLFSDLPGGNNSAGAADKSKWYHSDAAAFGFADGHGELRKRSDEEIYKYDPSWVSDTGRGFMYGRIWDPAGQAPEIQGQ